jgi:hypothetical protein
MDKEAKWAELRSVLKPVEAAPSLKRVNGWGCSLVGKYRDNAPYYFALYVFTIVWLPLIPLQIYLVSGDFSGYRFHGTISTRDFSRQYPSGIASLALSCLLETALWLMGIFAFLFVLATMLYFMGGTRHHR